MGLRLIEKGFRDSRWYQNSKIQTNHKHHDALTIYEWGRVGACDESLKTTDPTLPYRATALHCSDGSHYKVHDRLRSLFFDLDR